MGKFKPFIKVKGKKIIEWFLIGLKKNIKKDDNFYFITTNDYEKEFFFSQKIKKIFQKLKLKNKMVIKIVLKTPKGPALTVKSILSHIKDNKTCIIINPDQKINFDLPKKINKKNIYITLNFNQHGNSSYVRMNKKGKITHIKEKKLISFYASTGVYIFGSRSLLKNSFKVFKNKSRLNEISMSDIIENYLKKGKNLAYPIETKQKYDLGNLEGIKEFMEVMQ